MNRRLDLEMATLTPIPTVVLDRRTDWWWFERSTQEGIQRVRKAVAAAQVPTAGPPFTRYLSLGPRPRVDMGIPLDGPHAVPTLRTKILPGGDAATLWTPDRLEMFQHHWTGYAGGWIATARRPGTPGSGTGRSQTENSPSPSSCGR